MTSHEQRVVEINTNVSCDRRQTTHLLDDFVADLEFRVWERDQPVLLLSGTDLIIVAIDC